MLEIGHSASFAFQKACSSTLTLSVESHGMKGEFLAMSFQAVD